jgi:prevent-host-death family protein
MTNATSVNVQGAFMKQINIAQAKAQLSDLVNRAVAGEEIVIARDNKPLVKLVSISRGISRQRKPGSATGLVKIAADFDAPLEEFAQYR